MEAARETLLIAAQDLREAARSKRAVFLLLIHVLAAVLVTSASAWVLGRVQAELDEQLAVVSTGTDPAALEDQKAAAYAQLISAAVNDEETATFLAGIPVVILLAFLGMRAFLPWLALLVGYDQINGELQGRSARYLFLRARRGSLIAGKLVSMMVLMLGLTAVVGVVIVACASLWIEGFDLAAGSRHMLRFWALLVPLSLCWTAVMSFLSSAFKGPYLALLGGVAAIVGTGVIAGMSRASETLSFLRWLAPGQYGSFLLSHRAADLLTGAAALVAFAALFTLLSYITLRMRDI